MLGSAGIAAFLARVAFLVLLPVGWMRGDLGPLGLTVFVALGLFAWLGLPRLMTDGDLYVTSVLAILDVALVFTTFKGDVRIG